MHALASSCTEMLKSHCCIMMKKCTTKYIILQTGVSAIEVQTQSRGLKEISNM